MNEEDGDSLTKHQEEQLAKFVAQMNVFAQHQKVLAEFTRSKNVVKEKLKK
jgi:hypothetical protein